MRLIYPYFKNTLISIFKTSKIFKANFSSFVPESDVSNLFTKLVAKDRTALSSAITLVETQNPQKKILANQLLKLVLQKANKDYLQKGKDTLSFRIGLTGPPGAGKSSFIEVMGTHLTSLGHKIAVLVVDPSSTTTGGSILGDRTRMTHLSRDPNAYIRPSPTGGHLGGVTRTTNEAIAICECAGYNIIFVETVGVGQAEYAVANMVDMVLLLIPPGSGDELQGLKRGIVEISDLVAITKSDGDFVSSAIKIQAEYVSALKFFRQRSKVWQPKVKRISSKNNEGIEELWKEMKFFREESLKCREFETKRSKQQNKWLWEHVNEQLVRMFCNHPAVKEQLPEVEQQVATGVITPGQASDLLIQHFVEDVKS